MSGAASFVVEFAKALGWPVAVLLMAFAFRKPVADFFSAIGGRINKLSVFKVEIELASAKAPASTPLLDDIRTTTNPALLSDSARSMIDQVQSTVPADFALIALGRGQEWLTSRLMIAAVMMERMRGVKVFVFVEWGNDTDHRFVAVAPVRQLRWLLALRYPWLEAAVVRAEAVMYQASDPLLVTMAQTSTDSGALEPAQAQQLARRFIASLQRPNRLPPGAALAAPEPGWTRLGTMEERAEWMTGDLLRSLLPDESFRAFASAMSDAPRVRRSRALLRCHAPFVAMVDERREFMRLVNRRTYLEELAAALGEEPEHAAS